MAYAASAVAGYGHVAGTYNATFGLPPFEDSNAVLFSASLSPSVNTASKRRGGTPNATFAAVKLSSPVTYRFTPHSRWRALWNYIVATVMGLPDTYCGIPDWVELVHTSHDVTAASSLTTTDMAHAVMRATSWMGETSGLLIVGDNSTCPAPNAGPDSGLVVCILEGLQSKMSWNGSQVRVVSLSIISFRKLLVHL